MKTDREEFYGIEEKRPDNEWRTIGTSKVSIKAAKMMIAKYEQFYGVVHLRKYRVTHITITTTRKAVKL